MMRKQFISLRGYYLSNRTKTDFALVELERSINSCSGEEIKESKCWFIAPVKLPDPQMKIEPCQDVRTLGQTVIITQNELSLIGWGATEFSLVANELLYQADLKINNSNHFNALETNVGPHGTDPCDGDSGGPLLFRGDDYEWVLVGTLIGGGFDCYNPEDRSDNTSDWNKVTIHVPWIQSLILDKLDPIPERNTEEYTATYSGKIYSKNQQLIF